MLTSQKSVLSNRATRFDWLTLSVTSTDGFKKTTKSTSTSTKRGERNLPMVNEPTIPKKAKEKEIVLEYNTPNSETSTKIVPEWIPQPTLHKNKIAKSTATRRPPTVPENTMMDVERAPNEGSQTMVVDLTSDT